MLSGVQEEAVMASSNTDSCQTAITPQVVAPQVNTQKNAVTTIKPSIPRKTFVQQEPAIFFIWGFAIIYIVILIANSTIRNKKVHN